MTSGNGAEPSGGQPAADHGDGALDTSADNPTEGAEPEGGAVDGEDTPVDPAPEASADPPRTRHRKAGVEYRPV
ncbi:hypothetical protein RVR_4710 [Actinacidiphila reveromycinica]|uniref:Uncharacterized protein n=1 Tax=Actinacidiphila reveromycinica TaxID=659352 RepID=A0A7U3UTS8_9ACTN|nr:hypothetical protein [Streptomyces sp. SN-593]BBA98508.1 hypothetical protein RVR_4710 [Streptomyces sp. SN-593]